MAECGDEWSGLMRAAVAGDAAAYRKLLAGLAVYLRPLLRAGLRRSGCEPHDCEDIVQETLLAIHLKRHTWDPARPVLPWVRAVARNKLIDAMRRRSSHVHVDLDEVADELPAEAEAGGISSGDIDRLIGHLEGRQKDVAAAMIVNGSSARDAAERLGMSEGAVRVTLHRALKALAAKLKERGS